MKVALLLSGGVDSSVALALLREQGHDVTAFYLKIWLEDELSFLGNCPWEEDLAYAQATADMLNVPLHVVPFQKAYHERVVAYTIDAVRQGLTPNPDMLCNREVKFGAFEEMHGAGFDAIATGHYARTVRGADGLTRLHTAPDAVKDQTYFLAMLRQEQLARALFPIGHLTKPEVRAIAAAAGLPTATRKDSQGICFLGKISFHDFVRHHCGTLPGPIVHTATGAVLGQHDGHYFYTTGQRRGLDLPGGPWYVARKDAATNTVYVAHGFADMVQWRSTFAYAAANWIAEAPATGTVLDVKLRHGPRRLAATVTLGSTDPTRGTVTLAAPDQGITPGQFVVFYAGDTCLGGAVIADGGGCPVA